MASKEEEEAPAKDFDKQRQIKFLLHMLNVLPTPYLDVPFKLNIQLYLPRLQQSNIDSFCHWFVGAVGSNGKGRQKTGDRIYICYASVTR